MVFEEDNQDVEYAYHIEAMGHVVKECKSFRSKLQKLIKKEGSNMDGLIQRPDKEKIKNLLDSLGSCTIKKGQTYGR